MFEQPLVQDAKLLLIQIKSSPETIMAAIPAELQPDFITSIDVVIASADNVQTEADLLALADEIHRIIEDIPRLQALLLPDGRNVTPTHVPRPITPADHIKTSGKNEHLQERAARLKDPAIDCREALKRVLSKRIASKEKS